MVKVRFAPSPTGYLHLGNGRAAIFNYLFAKQNKGQFILRIDDTDKERSTLEYEEGIKEDLKWLGIKYDQEFKQSCRINIYEDIFNKLVSLGHIYPCYETVEELDSMRKAQLSVGKPPVYNRHALTLSEHDRQVLEKEGRIPHWRFKLSGNKIKFADLIHREIEFDLSSVSDPVVKKTDGGFTYTFASCVDDIDLGITHIIRGEDHVSNTASQIEILNAINPENNIKFGHYPLINFEDRGKMSKRLNDLSLRNFKSEGIEPDTIISFLATVGTSNDVGIYKFDQLLEMFSLNKVSKSTPKIFLSELLDLNRKNFASMSYEEVSKRYDVKNEDFWNLIKQNVETHFDIEEWGKICFCDITVNFEDKSFAAKILDLLSNLGQEKDWAEIWIQEIRQNFSDMKGKEIFHALRMLVTGKEAGPHFVDLIKFIGYEKIKERLEKNL